MRAEFDNYAEHYSALLADPIRDRFAHGDFFYRRKLMLIREFFCRFGLNAKQSCWVDIGCGQGDLLRLGTAEFGLSTGCDVSPSMLRGCEGLRVLRQEQDDVLPFPDGFADFATAICVYHHVPLSKRVALTREAARVLKPGGAFCIIEHNPVNPVTRMVVKRSPVDTDARC
jgi:SAM-dependent methyltransferase